VLPVHRFAARAAALLSIAAAAVIGGACDGGTVVYDAIAPKQCATGNGCPMVACTCNDGSFMIDSTCELGKCTPAAALCTDRCSPYMGVQTFIASKDDNVAIPACDALAERMMINKCGEGTELLASTCASQNIQCSAAASSFWKCVVEAGVLSCKRSSLRVENCSGETADLCTGPTP
jgi:hypothetical protein